MPGRTVRAVVLAALAVVLAAVLALALALGTLLPRPLRGGPGASGAGTTRILVLAGPIHTDLALPLDARTQERFAFLAGTGVEIGHPGADWLILGWGGRSFYLETPTWGDLRAGPVLRALTRDASVLHVDIAGPIAVPQEGVMAFDIDATARAAIEAGIFATFAREGGAVVAIEGAAYGPTDRFFEARGAFNALLGCNTWTAAMLRLAGLRTGWWTPLPGPLFASLALHNDAAGARLDGTAAP